MDSAGRDRRVRDRQSHRHTVAINNHGWTVEIYVIPIMNGKHIETMLLVCNCIVRHDNCVGSRLKQKILESFHCIVQCESMQVIWGFQCCAISVLVVIVVTQWQVRHSNSVNRFNTPIKREYFLQNMLLVVSRQWPESRLRPDCTLLYCSVSTLKCVRSEPFSLMCI